MKISKKKLTKLIDRRVGQLLRRQKKQEQTLKKQLEEVYALTDELSARPRFFERRRRFEEYED